MENKNSKLKAIFNKGLDLLFPKHIKCIFCDDELADASPLETCQSCKQNLPFIDMCCPKCGNPTTLEGVCLRCTGKNYAFAQARSVFKYQDKVRLALHKYKFDGVKEFAQPFAEYMLQTFAKWFVQVDVVVCVPLSPNRLKMRGYNQAEEIAKIFSQKANLPFCDCISKDKEIPALSSLDYVQRQKTIENVYSFKKEFKATIKDKTILLIDDIFTTGATTNEVAKLLVNKGCKRVFVLTLAHTILTTQV